MLEKYIKIFCQILLAGTTLVSCKTLKITLTDEKICAVAVDLSVGFDCATTISHIKSEMTLDEAIIMLNDGAIIMSADSFLKIKTTVDIACQFAGKDCTEDMKRTVETLNFLSKEKYKSPIACFGIDCEN